MSIDVVIESALDADVIARQVVNQKRRLKKNVPAVIDLATAITGIDITDAMRGSSSLKITIADQDWKMLDAGFFDGDADGRLDAIDVNYPDGSRLWWRLTQVEISGSHHATVSLVFMERAAVLLMGLHGPVKANRANRTRAEFLKSLVDRVKASGGLKFISKELHKTQQIAGGAVAGLPRSSTGHVFIEGDSLAVGSDPGVKSRLGTGWTVTADAEVGRSTATGYGNILAASLASTLPEVLVVELGTNDHGISDSTWRTLIDDICGAAGPSRHVVWVNLKGDGVDYSSMNASLADKATEHANLVVLDWAGLVDSESITLDPTLHVHPDSAGYRKRAKLIADALKDPKNTDGGSANLTKAQRRAAKNKGLTKESVKDIHVAPGVKLDEQQRRNLQIALDVADHLNAGDKPTKAMICSGFGEGVWRNPVNGLGFGGVLQGQVAVPGGTNWFAPMDEAKRTEEQAKSFLKGGRGFQQGGAIHLAKQHPEYTPGNIAGLVEVSGRNYPGSNDPYYDNFGKLADQVIAAFGGASPGTGAATYRKAYNFVVGRHENFWNASVRLAEDVNWPFFVDGDNVYFDSEMSLVRQQPVAVIRRGDPQVIDFDVTWDRRHIATEATLELVCDPFEFRAGEVFILNGFGPASAGSTARPKPLPGRWLIESFDRDRYAPTTTFTLKQPSPPKKEPAPDVGTKNVNYSDTNVTIDKGMTPQDIIDKIVLPIGKRHGLKTAQGLDLTLRNVEKANEAHTHLGSSSDHAGPSNEKWAVDMSNGLLTPQETACAKELADRFGIKWEGPDFYETTHDGFRYQLIHGKNFPEPTGDHRDHVHFGVKKVIYTGGRP